MHPSMNIGQAAAEAGVSAKMVRHYEQIGLLPEAERSEAGYRLYGPREVSVLRFVRQSRRLGFSVKQIADLIGLWSDSRRSSREVKAMAQRHLADLEEKKREIEQMMAGLSVLVTTCQGNDEPNCAILDKLSLDSPAQHRPDYKPRLRNGGAASTGAGDADSSGSTGHIDLMAWMRGVHVHHVEARGTP